MVVPHRVGDAPFYCGACETFPNGDSVVYGEQGEVIAATSYVPSDRVRIKFRNNTDWVDCQLTELGRTKPPDELGGGYHVGDTVKFEGKDSTFSSGNRLVHGEQGVVTGPSASDTVNQVAVKFPSNKGNVSCLLTNLNHFTSGSDRC